MLIPNSFEDAKWRILLHEIRGGHCKAMDYVNAIGYVKEMNDKRSTDEAAAILRLAGMCLMFFILIVALIAPVGIARRRDSHNEADWPKVSIGVVYDKEKCPRLRPLRVEVTNESERPIAGLRFSVGAKGRDNRQIYWEQSENEQIDWEQWIDRRSDFAKCLEMPAALIGQEASVRFYAFEVEIRFFN